MVHSTALEMRPPARARGFESHPLRKTFRSIIITMATPIVGDIYRHYKNKERYYEIVGVGRHTETLEDVVIYRALYDTPDFGSKPIWVRPLAMFLGTVIVDEKEVSRFERVDEKPRVL